MSKNRIVIDVVLDEEKLPQDILWKAASTNETSSSKALLLSLFERDSKDTLKIDLWTKDMQVAEMDRFFYHTLKGLADTYLRATSNKELANEMQKFVQYFGERTEIVTK